jgi:hypothetical protein
VEADGIDLTVTSVCPVEMQPTPRIFLRRGGKSTSVRIPSSSTALTLTLALSATRGRLLAQIRGVRRDFIRAPGGGYLSVPFAEDVELSLRLAGPR